MARSLAPSAGANFPCSEDKEHATRGYEVMARGLHGFGVRTMRIPDKRNACCDAEWLVNRQDVDESHSVPVPVADFPTPLFLFRLSCNSHAGRLLSENKKGLECAPLLVSSHA